MFPEPSSLLQLFSDFHFVDCFDNEPSFNTPMEPVGERIWSSVYHYWKNYLVADQSDWRVRYYMVPTAFDVLGMYAGISHTLGDDIVYDWRQVVFSIAIDTGIRRFPRTHVTDLQMLTNDGKYVCYSCFLKLGEDKLHDYMLFRENHWCTSEEELMMTGLCAFCEECRSQTMRQVVKINLRSNCDCST